MGEKLSGSAVFHEINGWQLRLRLDRWWSDLPRALVGMANPSKAGAEENDPTILWLAKRFRRMGGVGGFTAVNFEPLIATDPADLRRWQSAARCNHPEAYAEVRRVNNTLVRELSEGAAVRFVAWGALVEPGRRASEFLAAMSCDDRHTLFAFDTTQDGAPKHPMARGKHRIPDDAEPIIWQPAALSNKEPH